MAIETKETITITKKRKITKFLKEVKAELKKVIWPNRQQLVNNTLTVLASCTLVGIVIWVVDFGLERLYKLLFTGQ